MAAPPIPEVTAPPGWRAIEFISDLHLQPSEPATFEAWRRYLAATAADAIFILGDLFEAWPGDDVAQQPGFAADCVDVLSAATRLRPVFFMHGNRDFLVGDAFAQLTGVRLLADPSVLVFAGRRWLLSHGDALCLGDTEYLRFRAQVRDPAWQRDFLAQPLVQRQAVAQSLRAQSEDRKRAGAAYADVDAPSAAEWLRAADAGTLIHGHTHRPGEHELGKGLSRVVLTDWDLAARPPRGEALRLSDAGAQRIALS